MPTQKNKFTDWEESNGIVLDVVTESVMYNFLTVKADRALEADALQGMDLTNIVMSWKPSTGEWRLVVLIRDQNRPWPGVRQHLAE